MRTFKAVYLVVGALAAAPLLSACGSDTEPGSGSVAVTLRLGGLDVSPASLPSGRITFRVDNADSVEVHELVVARSDLAAAELPLDSLGEEVDESALEVVDEVEDVAPAAAGELTVDLQPGHYVLLCNLPGHYGASMFADFEVTP
jgi:uncharacterized cupredoxin-like copper-binding protein